MGIGDGQDNPSTRGDHQALGHGVGASAPRTRSPQRGPLQGLGAVPGAARLPPSNNAGLMMEVWASVAASWLGGRPAPMHFPASPFSAATAVAASSAPGPPSAARPPSPPRRSEHHAVNGTARTAAEQPAPTISTALRCTVPGCPCDCFLPGARHIRYCDSCGHGWVPHALDKLGCRQNFGQGPVEPVEPVQPHALLDIASLALYGCHALPVRLKILLDRLFSVLRPDQVVQVLRGFGWTQDDYARGYILNEANGASLDRFNICSPEEEPLVLQQFLRFGETRALTEQLLRGAAAPGAAGAASAGPSPASSASSQSSKPGQEASHAHERLQPAREEPVKTTPVHSPHQRDGAASTTAPAPSRHSPPPTSPGHRDARDDDKRMPHALNFSLGSSASSRQGPPSTGAAPVSPQQKHAPSGASSVGRQSPPSGQPTPHSALSFLNRGAQPQPQSPPGSSPLNRLQNMQPFDFRKMAASAVRASPEPPAGPGGVPGLLNLRPPPPPTVPTSTMSSLPLPFGHSSLTAANLVASSFPGLISSAMAGHPGHPSLPPHPGSKSPSTDLTSRAGSSDFGSASDDDDDNSALNLSRDRDPRDRDDKMRAKRSGSPPQQRSSKHPSSSFSPLKRQSAWPSSHLPANLGTQLINPTTGKKRVQCNVCLKTFCDKGALKIHFSAVHLREMHRCTVEGCSMMFSSRRSRNRHSANPNPKLHSPHLRRKISPHDGRSAQSHPILLPPHQAGLGVGLNPLSFGAFPLLPQDPRDPRDPRNAAMAAAAAAAGGPSALDLNLKNSLGLSLRYEREARERHREMTSMSMDEDDDDDEEGIVVVGGADDDDDEPQDLHQSKRLKFSVSDDGDDHSNTDDDSQSALDLGTSAASASNGVDHHGLGHHFAAQEPSEQARSGRKRKSQNPTRCTQPIAAEDLSNYDDSSSDAGSHMYPDQGAPPEAGLDLAVRRKSPDHTDTEERLAREQDSVQPPHEEGSSQDDQVFRLTKEKKGDSIEPPTENRVREMMSAAGGVKEDVEEEKDSVIKAEADPNGLPSSPCAGSPPCSPAASPASSLELGDGSHDEDGYFYPDGYFANIDVPMDKDNPRKCTACGKVFQNHFGVKTHYQNVHLKLMHKCTVDGCNAAFPSKRSRDRHSANLNLHRKLLSTSSSPTHGDKPGHPMFHPDVLARLYADPGMQGGRPLDHHPLLMAPFGYPAMGAMGAMGFHPLNGRAGSASPTSPRSLDEELMGRPAKPHDVHDPFLGARSRSDPGGLAMEPGLPLGLTHAAALAQRRASASDS